MSVSAKVDYACVAVLALAAEHNTGQPVPMRGLAKSHGIPAQFLAQIFQQLKAAGLSGRLADQRAVGLTRRPDQISLWQVVSAIESPTSPPQPAVGDSRAQRLSQAVRNTWQQLAETRRELLESTTFADLLQGLADAREPMYYIVACISHKRVGRQRANAGCAETSVAIIAGLDIQSAT